MTDELSSQPVVLIQKLDPDLPTPYYLTRGAAGFDLFAARDVMVGREPSVIPTGIAVQIPVGWEGQIRGRSGMAKQGILAHVGTIDSDYRGEVGVILWLTSGGPCHILRGTRIAQMIIAPVARAELRTVASLEETVRGAGGFGSTGV